MPTPTQNSPQGSHHQPHAKQITHSPFKQHFFENLFPPWQKEGGGGRKLWLSWNIYQKLPVKAVLYVKETEENYAF